MVSKIRTLLFSTLYPSSVRTGHGIFVETRLRHLVNSGEIESQVVAPVPWFPSRLSLFGEYARFARVPRFEQRNGFDVHHPRYLLLPKVGMNSAPHTLAHAGLTTARRLIAEGQDIDLIDSHYFYPDGVAATFIGQAIDKPVVITARGSDINLISQYDRPRRLIVDAARQAAAIIAVSSALRDKMIELGIDGEKIKVLGNGVDPNKFYQEDKAQAQSRWHTSGYVVVSVGNLVPTKGHDLVIRAIAGIPDACLLIAGQGPERGRLIELAAKLGVSDRVHLAGQLTQDDLRSLYSAADCLVLASVREGWPNVILEAMACGASIVASRVGGVPEILDGTDSGLLLDNRDVMSIVKAISELRARHLPRGHAQTHAARHGWNATTAGQISVFRTAIGASHA